MATFQRSGLKAASSSAAPCARPTPVRAPRASRVVALAVSQQSGSESATRRQALASVLAGASVVLLASPSPAFAFLGLDGDEGVKTKYEAETAAVLVNVNSVLALPRDDPSKDDRVKVLRKDINTWVANYRREPIVSGRPSFGNTYSALNAIAGHYNNFGTAAPIPKKRLDRLTKELADAELFLTRHR
ncbi:hypothetical protein FOA52_010019 [Chlamydomonas sp. UWO 241]|nr:hypothetical protein FOA52_010019 [Chlamydomonas sp. UWO 241]